MGQFFSLTRSLMLFMLAVGVVLIPVGWFVGGTDGAIGSSICCALSLGTGILAIALFCWLGEKNRVAAVMGGFSLRLFLTMGIALLIKQMSPSWGIREFYGWLIVVYLASLAWETKIMLSGASIEWSWLLGQPSKKL